MSHITQPLINTLQNNAIRKVIWDNDIHGFGIRSNKTSHTYILKYRNKYGRIRWYTIGNVGSITATQARNIAQETQAKICLGEDPAQLRKADKSILTVAQLCDWHLRDGVSHKKPAQLK